MRQLPYIFIIIAMLFISPAAFADTDVSAWPQQSRALLEQARKQPSFVRVASWNPQFYPTSDGKSYVLVWYRGDKPPSKWLVSLPGTQGYATHDFFVWSLALNGRSDIGFISIQWWLGRNDGVREYYDPPEINKEIGQTLARLNVQPDTAMLAGFRRGAANIYAVAALDHNKGHHYFSTAVASSGGMSEDYPPNQQIINGAYGKTPFAGMKWITSCGMLDPNPDRDGCPAMKKTAEWLKAKGADVILQIEDPAKGHGALNTNLANAKKVLDLYSGSADH